MEEQPLWFIIINPVACNGLVQKRWPELERLLQEQGIAYSVHFTEQKGHGTRLAEDAILKGYRYIMAVGGDGTNHEVTNGILGQTFVPSSDIFYALLPMGTGNDWARTHGISMDVVLRLQQLKKCETVVQDAGLIHYTNNGATLQRYFVNIAGLAYDGYIGMQSEKQTRQNRLQYLIMVAQYLFKYKLSKARITYDGKVDEDYYYTINIGICRYSGGGMLLTPHAVTDDGLFALTFARSLPKLEVLLLTSRFYNGTIIRHPKVLTDQVCTVSVEPLDELPTLLEADGEFLGQAPATFEMIEKALKVVL